MQFSAVYYSTVQPSIVQCSAVHCDNFGSEQFYARYADSAPWFDAILYCGQHSVVGTMHGILTMWYCYANALFAFVNRNPK